ncbi:MAG: 23S rRNA (guanosine(2251)-2'-O)-methyltransferase RlmB [Phascolarctobacterium sp.]|nr:23S rRNA (guanosine(2251)-2'-O)-methyltransferase RlmB [Candidatus Phascolarctobacterium caballi]
MENFIFGRNAVLEALRSGHSLNKVLIQEGLQTGSIKEVFALAKENNVVVEKVKAEKLDKLVKGKHQGVVAIAAPVSFVSLDDVFAKAAARHEEPFILVLDELQDPQNVGALIRTADAAGVHGVLIPQRHACPLNGTVAKISAGAVEYVPVVQIGNINLAIEELQRRGCWVVGADMSGTSYYETNLQGAVALVIGAEGKGLGRLVKEHCDVLISLPMAGGVNSLNASAAGAVLMYAIVEQRKKGKV